MVKFILPLSQINTHMHHFNPTNNENGRVHLNLLKAGPRTRPQQWKSTTLEVLLYNIAFLFCLFSFLPFYNLFFSHFSYFFLIIKIRLRNKSTTTTLSFIFLTFCRSTASLPFFLVPEGALSPRSISLKTSLCIRKNKNKNLFPL